MQVFHPLDHIDNKNDMLELVRDDQNQQFHLRVSYITNKKILDDTKLNGVIERVPGLERQIPLWLKTFVKCNLTSYLRGSDSELIEDRAEIDRKIGILIALSDAK